MKTFQFVDRTLVVGEVSQWEELVASVDKDTPATVVDLRTFVEAGSEPPPRSPEGWGYRRLPITGATVSEQDLDVLRREFFRRPSTLVIGPNSSRSRLLVAAALSRLEQGGWNGGKRAEVEAGHAEETLHLWLNHYLDRHGVETLQETSSAEVKVAPSSSKGEKRSSQGEKKKSRKKT